MNNIVSTNTVSHRIQDELKRIGFDYFTLRPWNCYRPENTLWWLVPSTEWPAYKYGKIVIFKTDNSDNFRVGFVFEKGFSTKAGQILSSGKAKKFCTKLDWIWNDMLNDIQSGKFEENLSAISKSLNMPLKILIQVSGINEKEASEGGNADLDLSNVIEFSYNGSRIECIKEHTKGEMSRYSSTNSMAGILNMLKAEDMEWFWIDFYVLVDFENSEWKEIEKVVPVFIENYEEIFRR